MGRAGGAGSGADAKDSLVILEHCGSDGDVKSEKKARWAEVGREEVETGIVG
jgi:hypothetical protein